MTNSAVRFKFSGMISPADRFHQPVSGLVGTAPDETYIAPNLVTVTITSPKTETIQVPQYANPVRGPNSNYDPANDCDGYFMSYKYQSNNNCYAYACNIAANSFPQPGRQSGYLITSANLTGSVSDVGKTISGYAEKDGLIYVGTSMSDVQSFTPPSNTEKGHFVALMVSPAGDNNWPGDYHWARCDNSFDGANSWSQKDGGDQVTNFDFAGNPISDPSTANWTVNQGPVSSQGADLVVDYEFYCFMYVSNPSTTANVQII